MDLLAIDVIVILYNDLTLWVINCRACFNCNVVYSASFQSTVTYCPHLTDRNSYYIGQKTRFHIIFLNKTHFKKTCYSGTQSVLMGGWG